MPRGRPKKKQPLWASKSFQFYLLMGGLGLALVLGVVQSTLAPKQARGGSEGLSKSSPRKGVYLMEIGSPIVYSPQEEGDWFFGARSHVGTWVSEIEKAARDPKILGLLLRVNSPGGSIGASEELYAALVRFKETGKKIVVSVVDLCASGAYYISLPADAIVANKGSIIGSIGVIASSWDLSDLMRRFGVRVNVVKSARNKDLMSPHRRMTAEERASLQRLVDEFHEHFVARIVEWRGGQATAAVVRRRANGQVYSASKAKEYGFIDSIGDFGVAKETIADLCDLKPDSMRLIKKEKKWSFLKLNVGSWFRWAIEGVEGAFSAHQKTSVEYR